MNSVYFNDTYIDMDEASLPILDRGLLFGDGIYEVIPVDAGQMIGFELHIQRLNRNLGEIGIQLRKTTTEWRGICQQLIEKNGGDRPIYLQVSRGTDIKRLLTYPDDLQPTVFAFCLEQGDSERASRLERNGYTVATAADIRWKRCDIKSTSMLASTMTVNHAAGCDEVIMFNTDNQLTEGCSSNVFVIKNGVLATPALGHQILPGITRHILLNLLKEKTSIAVEERAVLMTELVQADEVLLSSSTKGVVAVTKIDGVKVGDGKPGQTWQRLHALYQRHKVEY